MTDSLYDRLCALEAAATAEAALPDRVLCHSLWHDTGHSFHSRCPSCGGEQHGRRLVRNYTKELLTENHAFRQELRNAWPALRALVEAAMWVDSQVPDDPEVRYPQEDALRAALQQVTGK